MTSTQVMTRRAEIIIDPVPYLLDIESCTGDIGSRFDLLNPVMIGLYSSMVIAELRPYFNKLKGKKVGTSISTTTARGAPIYIGTIR